jgi:hypothetical protein
LPAKCQQVLRGEKEKKSAQRPEFFVVVIKRKYWLPGAEVFGPGTHGVVDFTFIPKVVDFPLA